MHSKAIITFVILFTVASVFFSFNKRNADPAFALPSNEDDSLFERQAPSIDKETHTQDDHPKGKTLQNNDATENEQVKAEAKSFYDFVFPGMVSSSSGDMTYEVFDETTTGNPIYVKNYFDDALDTVYIPISAYESVIALVILRKFGSENYKPARVMDVSHHNWNTFPPISKTDAELKLVTEYDNNAIPKGEIVHIGTSTLYYQFELPTQEGINFLVSATDGSIMPIPENFSPFEKEERVVPVRLDSNGMLEINSSEIENLSKDKLDQLHYEIEESNRAIEKGLLKIGPDLEVIFDKREKPP